MDILPHVGHVWAICLAKENIKNLFCFKILSFNVLSHINVCSITVDKIPSLKGHFLYNTTYLCPGGKI